MRTIKFLGLAAALAAVSVSASAQAARRFDHFIGLNDVVRLEARQFQRQQMHRFAMARAQRPGQVRGSPRGAAMRGPMSAGAMRGPMGVRGAGFAGPRGRQMMMAGRVGQFRTFQDGRRAGMQLGARAGFRAGLRANATPEQAAFVKQLGEQRQAIRAQVQAGKLTREQARTQMQAWVAEHRPKK